MLVDFLTSWYRDESYQSGQGSIDMSRVLLTRAQPVYNDAGPGCSKEKCYWPGLALPHLNHLPTHCPIVPRSDIFQSQDHPH